MSRNSEFRDGQILLAIKKLNGCSIFDLFKYCVEEYPNFNWDYHNIRNSISRLLNKDKIKIGFDQQKIIYPRNNVNYIRNMHIKIFSYKEDNTNNSDGGFILDFKI